MVMNGGMSWNCGAAWASIKLYPWRISFAFANFLGFGKIHQKSQNWAMGLGLYTGVTLALWLGTGTTN